MYDLADGYDSWLDRLDALNAQLDNMPAPMAAVMQPSRGKPYTRPADDKARLAQSIRDASRRYPHRSHRHQAGEES